MVSVTVNRFALKVKIASSRLAERLGLCQPYHWKFALIEYRLLSFCHFIYLPFLIEFSLLDARLFVPTGLARLALSIPPSHGSHYTPLAHLSQVFKLCVMEHIA